MKKIVQCLSPVYRDSNNPTMPSMISIVSAKYCARLSIDDIEYIEQIGRVLHIYTLEKDYSIYENIYKIEGMLVGRGFYKPLRSMIINFDHINNIDENIIVFESGRTVMIGKNALSRTRDIYRKFLQGYPNLIMFEESLKVAEKR